MTSVSVSTTLVDYAANSAMPPVSISDNSTAIAANIDALNIMALAGAVSGIKRSDTPAPLAISLDQLNSDTVTLQSMGGRLTGIAQHDATPLILKRAQSLYI
ncbi:MAG: hypothetical protein ABSB19_01155 [Methylomonas sp.]|jgi:hypothetical protein